MGKIRIATTNSVLKLFKEVIKEKKWPYVAKLESVEKREYQYMFGMFSDYFEDMDNRGNIKVIKVLYPEEYYCEPLCVNTEMLNEWFKFYHCETVEDFKFAIAERIEV